MSRWDLRLLLLLCRLIRLHRSDLRFRSFPLRRLRPWVRPIRLLRLNPSDRPSPSHRLIRLVRPSPSHRLLRSVLLHPLFPLILSFRSVLPNRLLPLLPWDLFRRLLRLPPSVLRIPFLPLRPLLPLDRQIR